MNLYESIDIVKHDELLNEDNRFNCYCPECGKETTFERSDWYERKRAKINLVESSHVPGWGIKHMDDMIKIDKKVEEMFEFTERDKFINRETHSKLFIKEFECCMNRNHRRYDIYYKSEDKIIKIGQYPSEYDNGNKDYLDKLKVVCSNKESREIVQFIKKALIMESNGLGIPALVYMRRAFEKMIAIAESKNKLDNVGIKMADRIKNNPLLPPQIKENTRLYNIISEGIHNETEEECMELFKIIKVGFTVLLRKTYEHVQEEKELEEISKFVSLQSTK